ncbi:hypothetical protein AMK59_3204 [Oryctes borbonicus]|uniref:DNA/RNA non-specific endonuclease domain-containing protein n=1 Tax=Oryctes borbonicus TaxID=1629725 RepID=A0A0T6B5D5_9SCAR|nr:hypothetical protein AMK59_3204 [Oryctes borbonicus]
MLILVLGIFAKILSWNSADGRCYMSPSDEVLLIDASKKKPEILMPVPRTTFVLLRDKDSVEIYCPRRNDEAEITGAICRYGTLLNNNLGPLDSVWCAKSPEIDVQYTGENCSENQEKFQIGFPYKENEFLHVIENCFSNETRISRYTISTISKAINGNLTLDNRSKCETANSFDDIPDLNQLYGKEVQRNTINKQLGFNYNSSKYINDTHYLRQGYLTPRADFIYKSQQDAASQCLNVVPQWKILNEGNWKILESNLRDLASSRGIDLGIYTGTSGILSFPHNETGELTELYLNVDGTKKVIPIPKYIWKIAFDDVSQRSIAFVAVNNPYLDNLEDVTICTNICHVLSYITFNSSDYIRNGYVYCCAVQDLPNTILIPEYELIGGIGLLA